MTIFCFSLLLVRLFFGGFCGEVGGMILPWREVGGVSMALCPPPTEDRGSSGEMR